LDHFVISDTSGGNIPDQVVNAPFSVLIKAVDASGNTVTSFNGSVYLTSNLGAVKPTSVGMTSGQGTPSVTLYNSGTTRLNCSGTGAYGYSNYFGATGGSACTGSITGSVIDCKDAAVSGATVRLYNVEGTQVTNTTTDSGGKFSFGFLACGKYEIQVEKDGEGASGIMKTVAGTYCTTAFNILLPINCGTKDTPVVLVPGIMGSSQWYWGIVPRLPDDEPASASDLYIHAEKTTGFQQLKKTLKDLDYTVVECPWDWRMQCGKAYGEYLRDKLDEALKKSTTGKVHIVAHSMGGLVVRAYIQSEDYLGDIDKVAFVGTPHLGSSNPYYMWEGGDPKTADDLTDKGLTSGLNLYTNSIEELWKDTYKKKGWDKDKHDKIREFLRDKTKSLLELMYTGSFLTDTFSYWAVGTSGNINTWLKDLNAGSNGYGSPASVMSKDGSSGTKVEARLFVGDKGASTISRVIMALKKGSAGAANDLYEDGIPRNEKPKESNVVWGTGDGTVPYDSAVYPYTEGWAALCPKKSDNSHSSLINDFVGEIVDFLDPQAGSDAAMAVSETTTTAELSVGITGDMRVLVTDPQSRKTGADPATGTPVTEIPDSQCAFDAGGGGSAIENPAAGTYQITYFGGADRDFQLDIEYRDDDVSETYNYRGFRPAAARTFSVVVNPTGNPRLTITPPAKAPTNLQANPYTSGTEKTRLTWTATGEAGLTGYNIYAVAELEPYFTKVTTVGAGTTTYDTADAWSSSNATTVKTYAVAAVKTGGIESFFSNLAQNNDRDHDGLTDAEEPGLGTDPIKADTDGDGLKDGDEQAYNTNPLVKDTDGDGYNDYAEIQAGTDPLDPQSMPATTRYVEPAGACGTKTPCYTTLQAALNAATDGDTIQAAKTLSPAEPVWSKTGTVTIIGGWKTDFSAKDGTTSMYAPRATGGGGVKVEPNVKIIPKP